MNLMTKQMFVAFFMQFHLLTGICYLISVYDIIQYIKHCTVKFGFMNNSITMLGVQTQVDYLCMNLFSTILYRAKH